MHGAAHWNLPLARSSRVWKSGFGGFPGFPGAHHFIKDLLVEDHEKGPYSHVCGTYDSRLGGSLKGCAPVEHFPANPPLIVTSCTVEPDFSLFRKMANGEVCFSFSVIAQHSDD
jgi:hypothetical protein